MSKSNKPTIKWYDQPEERKSLEEAIPGIAAIYDAFLASFEERKRDKARDCVHAYARWKRQNPDFAPKIHPRLGERNLEDFCQHFAHERMRVESVMDNTGGYFLHLCVEADNTIEKLLKMLKRQETTKMTNEQKIEVGKQLLRELSKEYNFANDFTDEHVKNTGETRDDIAYSCWSYASVEAAGVTSEQARDCINAALIDLEKHYKFKPKN